MPKRSTRRKAAIDHEQSSGNVFADVGLPEEYMAKADLVSMIATLVSERGLTQMKAAGLLRIDQPRVSALLRGKLDMFSLEKLMTFVKRLGNRVEIRVKQDPTEPRLVVAPLKTPFGHPSIHSKEMTAVFASSRPMVTYVSSVPPTNVSPGRILTSKQAFFPAMVAESENRRAVYAQHRQAHQEG